MSLYNDASLLLIPSGYKSGKVYSQKPTDGDGDLTFTRASNATRVNSLGSLETMGTGVPRLDYSSGSCPALLLEPQRTNLMLRSEEFDQNPWIRNELDVIPNSTTAPDGNTTADTITVGVDASAVRHRLVQTKTLVSGSTYTGTYYLKAKDHQWIQIIAHIGFPSDVWANFDLVNGTIGNTGGAGTTASIEHVGDGWYRCRVSGTTNGTNTTGFEILLINNTNGGRYPSYQSLVAEEVCYVWGAQLEEGAFATSYIPTLGTSATRVQEGQKVENIADLIGQTEGTIFIDVNFRVLTAAGFRAYFSLEGSVSGQFSGFNVSNALNGNNVNYAGISYALTEGRHKIVCTYSQANNERKLYVDGVLRATSTHANFLATIDKLSVGCRINSFTSFNTDRPLVGGVNQFALFPILLSNDDCLTLSTL